MSRIDKNFDKVIGHGTQGIVYEYTRNKVIKCSNNTINEKIMNLVSIKNIGPKYFGVFKTESGVNCYIQEKLYPIDIYKLETGVYDRKLCKLITELIIDGIFHNDIKYDNILVTKEGELRLIDFDLSTEISDYGYKKFDNLMENNMEIILKNGEIRSLKFTDKEIEKILKMRPRIPKTLLEIENEDKLRKAREEAKLLVEERMEKYGKNKK
jgi:serine/threonine protein kinase